VLMNAYIHTMRLMYQTAVAWRFTAIQIYARTVKSIAWWWTMKTQKTTIQT
jgi:hypothetical protein